MDNSGVILLIQALINAKIANKWVVLAMVLDRHFGSGSGLEPNQSQICGPGRQ